MQNFDVLTLVFLGLAVFVIFKLRSVLGTRTGTERKPEDMMRRDDGGMSQQQGAAMPNNVVPMPGMRQPNTPAVAEPEARLAALMPKDHPAFPGLVQIMSADPEFDPQDFVQGARGAYEMIVMAFAQGDKRTLKDLLAKDVFEGFESAINDREKRKEKVETQFVSIDKAEIIDSMLRVRNAQVTVKFLSKLITATRDAAGTVIDGSAEKVSDVTDIWTFQRDVSTNDPNWRLIATESAQ